MAKRIYRSRTNKIIAGVCGGVGEYFDIDPTIVRLLWVIFLFAWGTGLIGYIVALIIMPERPQFEDNEYYAESNNNNNFDSQKTGTVLGWALIIIGAALFAMKFFNWRDFKYILAIALIGGGIYLILKERR